MKKVESCAKVFKKIAKEKFVRVFSHFDCDGICSASIFAKMLARENVKFSITFLKQLTKNALEKICVREDELITFLDFGSGQLDNFKNILEKTQVFVLDHHFPKKFEHINLFHLNPLIFQEEEISSSSISYIFAKFVNIKNVDLVDLAVIGSIGDELEIKWKFKGLSEKILKEAEELGKISVLKGIRLYGRNKPIHQALANTFDPFIPGISGSESQAVQFLSELGIQLKVGNEFKRLKDLSFEEQKKLASAIILERLKMKEEESEDIFGNIYILHERVEEIEDAREFATLLNACGRMGNPEIGLALCLGNYSVLDKALEILNDYRKLISSSLRIAKEMIREEGKISYFIAKDKVPDSIVGTITSILLNSLFINSPKILVGFANSEDLVKISMRTNMEINLRELVANAIKKIGGEGGGHEKAAGAYIPKGFEEKFIEFIKGELSG